MNTRECFDTLRAQVLAADDVRRAFEIDLSVKYGGNVHYAKAAERKRLEHLRDRFKRHADRLFTLIVEISPRDWSVSIPWFWIVTALSYEDATTRGQLATIPPPAYGYTTHTAQQFAAPIAEVR